MIILVFFSFFINFLVGPKFASFQEVKPCEVDEDEEVDILTVNKDPDFSDSDMSQEELCFLPADPKFDAPERTDESVESSSRMRQ